MMNHSCNSFNNKKKRCAPCKKVKRSATTLDVTIVPQPNPDVGTISNYFKLQCGRGDKTLVRQELACARRNRRKRRKPLASFVQITDVHIIDAASPSRAAFLAQYIPEVKELADSFRPQEALSNQVAEAMVRKINSVKVGPITKQPFSFVISCGDNGDGEQKNELQNYINLLDGTRVVPNPATPGLYIGVQDNTPTVNFNAYYHPDKEPSPELTDIYKVEFGFPDFPGILNEAARPFCATGLNYPWYTANGNHDCTKLGNYGLNLWSMLELFDQIATGELPEGLGSKLVQAMNPTLARAFVRALELQDPAGVFEVIKRSVLRDIPKSDKRVQYTRDDFIAMHFNTTEFPGPVGHGFSEQNRINSTLYYEFEVSDSISGFVLDTCNPSGNLLDVELAPNGSIGRRQLSWLESELIARHSSYFNTQNQLVFTENQDRLCVLFSHHDSTTMNNIFHSADAVDPDPQKVDGVDFIQFVQRFPNVILFVNGHTHRNIVRPLPTPDKINKIRKKILGNRCKGKCNFRDNIDKASSKSARCNYNGFWEINTASFIDYPQEARIIEIVNNCDGTLSIFGTIIDHLSPPCVDVSGPKYSITEMASISRELSFNDFFNDPRTRGGLPKDRNVELLINNPLIRDRKRI